MKRVTVITSLLMLFIHFNAFTFGQDVPKWGKVPAEILARTALASDTSAPACVIFDIGEKNFSSTTFEMEFNRHVRIQIFKEAGKDQADIKIPYWYDENIGFIKAQTLLPSGKKIKLRNKQIFDEGEKKGWRYKTFAIPGVESSCVVEYKYTIVSGHIAVLDPWYFQAEIPTERSRIAVGISRGFLYNSYLMNTPDPGYEPEIEWTFDSEGKDLQKYQWEFRDLDAIREEPHMTTMKDYLASLNFQLIEFKDHRIWHKFVRTWGDLREVIFPTYDSFFHPVRVVRDLSDHIVNGELFPPGIIEKLYCFVRDSIEVTSYKGYYGDRLASPQEILKNRAGSRVEKNLLLMSLLLAAGLDAQPVLISTRTHGQLDRQSPRLRAFNHLLVATNRYNTTVFLDTRNPYCPANMNPQGNLTHSGWMLDEASQTFVRIPLPEDESLMYAETVNCELDLTGDLAVEADIRYEGYRNIYYRQKYAESKGKDDFVKTVVLQDVKNIDLDSCDVTVSEDRATPMRVFIKATVRNYADIAGDRIYFSPGLFYTLSENVFKPEKRTYPVNYAYPRVDQEKITLELPKGFEIEEVPESRNERIRGHEFERYITVERDRLVCIRRLRVFDLNFLPYEYQKLRSFYSTVVNADQDQVVLVSKRP